MLTKGRMDYSTRTSAIKLSGTIRFGHIIVLALSTCSKYVCAFTLEKQLRTEPKQYSGFHTVRIVLSERYFFEQRISSHETDFYRTMTQKKIDEESQVNNVVHFG